MDKNLIYAIGIFAAVVLWAKSRGVAAAGGAITDTVMRPNLTAQGRNPLTAAPVTNAWDIYNLTPGEQVAFELYGPTLSAKP